MLAQFVDIVAIVIRNYANDGAEVRQEDLEKGCLRYCHGQIELMVFRYVVRGDQECIDDFIKSICVRYIELFEYRLHGVIKCDL